MKNEGICVRTLTLRIWSPDEGRGHLLYTKPNFEPQRVPTSGWRPMGRSENCLKPGCVSVIAGSIPCLLKEVCAARQRPLGRVSKRCQKGQVGHQAGRPTLGQGCGVCDRSACLRTVPEALDAAVPKNNICRPEGCGVWR